MKTFIWRVLEIAAKMVVAGLLIAVPLVMLAIILLVPYSLWGNMGLPVTIVGGILYIAVLFACLERMENG